MKFFRCSVLSNGGHVPYRLMTELQYCHFLLSSPLERASSIQDHFDSRGRRRRSPPCASRLDRTWRRDLHGWAVSGHCTVQIDAGIAVFSSPRSIAVVSKVIPSSGRFWRILMLVGLILPITVILRAHLLHVTERGRIGRDPSLLLHLATPPSDALMVNRRLVFTPVSQVALNPGNVVSCGFFPGVQRFLLPPGVRANAATVLRILRGLWIFTSLREGGRLSTTTRCSTSYTTMPQAQISRQ